MKQFHLKQCGVKIINSYMKLNENFKYCIILNKEKLNNTAVVAYIDGWTRHKTEEIHQWMNTHYPFENWIETCYGYYYFENKSTASYFKMVWGGYCFQE